MTTKIDFILSRQFGRVEQIIFRLVLNGFTDASEIVEALPLFSDLVIANSIKRLVNRQILTANIKTRKLSISEPLVAIIEACLTKEIELDIPEELEPDIKEDGLLIGRQRGEEESVLKHAILAELLPNIKLDIYIEAIDFIIKESK